MPCRPESKWGKFWSLVVIWLYINIFFGALWLGVRLGYLK